MYPEPYKEWIKLFNDDFAEIWQNERKELQKIAVLLFALQNELKNVQTSVEVEVSNLKQQIKYRDDLEKKTKHLSPQNAKNNSPSTGNKENIFENHIGLKKAENLPVKRNQNEGDSPDLFKDIDLNTQSSSADISIIDLSLSEDDALNIDGSPTIKKKRKRYKVIPKPPAFDIISESEEKFAIPHITNRESVKTNLFKLPTPKADHNLSVIECSPEVSTRKSKALIRVGNFISKKKTKIRKSNNTTLTQIFRASTRTNEKTEDGADSDETFYDDNSDETKMGITDLLDYINNDESGKQEEVQGNNKNESICQELQTSSQEVDQFSKGAIFNERELDLSSEKHDIIITEPEPIVRGKARKQLHGWSCQQCKNFYGQMKLSPEEIQKKMDECSRHRYKYRPPDETMPGGCVTVLYCKSQHVQRRGKYIRRIIIQKRNAVVC